MKGAGKKASDGIVKERASIEDRRKAFGAATVVICGPRARVDAPELEGARKCASVNWLTDAFGSKRLGHVDDYAPLPAVVGKPPPPPEPEAADVVARAHEAGVGLPKGAQTRGELPPNDKIVRSSRSCAGSTSRATTHEPVQAARYETGDKQAEITRKGPDGRRRRGVIICDGSWAPSSRSDSNKGLVKKIQEIHESGDLDRLRTYRADPRRCAIMELSKVWGIGYGRRRR